MGGSNSDKNKKSKKNKKSSSVDAHTKTHVSSSSSFSINENPSSSDIPWTHKKEDDPEENKASSSSSFPPLFKRFTVSLTRRRSTNQHQQQQQDPNQKILFVSPQDLLDLNLSSHDEVLLCTLNNNHDGDINCTEENLLNTILSSLYQKQQQQPSSSTAGKRCIMTVCQVQIFKAMAATTTKNNNNHRKNQNQQSTLSTATLSGPTWFLQRFHSLNQVNNNDTTTTNNTTTTAVRSNTQSFFNDETSFQDDDDDDMQLLSSNTTRKTPSSASKNSPFSFTHLVSSPTSSSSTTTTTPMNKKVTKNKSSLVVSSTTSPNLKNSIIIPSTTTTTTTIHGIVIPIKSLLERRTAIQKQQGEYSIVSSSSSSTIYSTIHMFPFIIGKAKSITLQPCMEDTTTTTWVIPSILLPNNNNTNNTSTSCLQLLLSSYLYKLYITIHDVVAVYILGQRVFFRVLHIQGKEDDDDDDEGEKDNDLNQKISCNHDNKVGPRTTTTMTTCLLYQMDWDTKINVQLQEDEHNKKKNMEEVEIRNDSTKLTTSFTNLHLSTSNDEDDVVTAVAQSTSLPSTSIQSTIHINQKDQKLLVAGLDSYLQQVYSFILPSLFYPTFNHHNNNNPILRPSKGLLIHGPNGVGKTLVAQQIVYDFDLYNNNKKKNTEEKEKEDIYNPSFPCCTILDSLLSKHHNYHRYPKVHVEWISCAYLQAVSSFIGEGEKQLTQIFDQAEYRAQKEQVSSLLIFDDIHLIGSTRSFQGGGGNGGGSITTDRITSTLLALLDGIGKYTVHNNKQNVYNNDDGNHGKMTGHVFVIAITSKPMELDSALRRAGRMDKELEIPIPDELCRGEIFSFLFEKLQRNGIEMDPCLLSPSSHHISCISKLAKGFTGADCTLSVKEAVREAILSKPQDECVQLASSMERRVIVTLDHIQRAIRKTKPSSIKSISVEIPSVPWSSIGGMSQVKQQLREAIEYPLKYDHVFKKMNIPPPKGILLYGPPGCSKTLLARAIASEGHMNFLAVKGPELLSKWLGESERALASLFQRARMASPCVIFFDEIDAIGSKRGQSDGSTGGDRLLSQLLTELDGVSTSSGNIMIHDEQKMNHMQPKVVLVGATNRPDLLDSALIRPGRIDRMIYVGVPDEISRADIFRISLQNKACAADVDPTELAANALTEGYSGAEIVSICQDAALLALEEDGNSLESSTMGPCIYRRHLLRALQYKKKQITPEMIAFYQSFRK